VVTAAVDPAGQQRLLAGVLGPQLTARVGAIHEITPLNITNKMKIEDGG
jgi:hypothetical protein